MRPVVDVCAAKWADDVDNREARRLFHGRGHSFPGYEHVVVNWYPPFVVVSLYGAADPAQVQALCSDLRALRPDIEGVAVQQRDGRRTHTAVLWGGVPDQHEVMENGLRYWIEPCRNQNVGLFLDMAHVRRHLRPFFAGARVLNLFAYTCAFSVSALDAGAVCVVNNDMSRNALRWGERNHALNGQDLRSVRMLPHNLFKSWWKIRQYGPYDVIIIDPPTNQKGSFVAEKSYGQVLKRIPEFAARGARVLACLNSPFLDRDFLTGLMARWSPTCELRGFLPAHPDFPDRFPERALKVAEFVYR